jgi:hypothetical protein
VPGRKEIHIIEQWIASKLKLIDEKDPIYSKHANFIHEFVLLELIRQTSVECSERGSLFMKIFEEFKKNNLKYSFKKNNQAKQ